MRKKVLLGILVVAVLVVGAVIALHLTVNASGFRTVVETRASAALGRPVSVGDLRFSILPMPGLRAGDVAVAPRPGEGTGNVLSLKSLRIGARLLPLLRGRLEVTKVVLVEPTLDLTRDSQGNWNVELPGASGAGGSEAGPAVAIDEVRIVRGRVRIRDASRSAAAPLELALDDLGLEVRGLGGEESRIAVSSGRLAITDPALGPQPLAVEIANARLTVQGGGSKVELADLELAAGHTTITVSGDLQEQPQGRRLDLDLQPTRIDAADLGVLLARVTGDPKLTISGQPVSLEGGVHGLLAAGRPPAVRARAIVDGITLHSSTLTQPITDVHATASLDGAELAIEKLTAKTGASDVAGSLRLSLADPPTLRFDLESQHADLGELMGLLPSTGGEQAAPAPDSFTVRAVADGTLKVAKGSLANLRFQDLTARMRMHGGVATLEPVTMKLYDGSFQGRLETDLTRSPQAFAFTGAVDNVDVGALVAAETGSRGLLAGRTTARISGRGAGTDPKALIAGLQAEGTVEIVDGEVGRLDVLGQVAQVAGVLGQQTLARVAGGSARNATTFSRLSTELKVAGGELQLDKIVLLSPDFDLTGSGTLNLSDSLLKGRFQIAFSPQVSGWMKQEGSRAASLFWDQASGRVTLPVELSGPLDHPGATVDWGATVRELARGRVESQIGGLLGNLLGNTTSENGTDQRQALAPSPSSESPPTMGETPPPASRSSTTRAQSPSGKMTLVVARTEWGGSFLAKDFTIQLEVRGAAAKQVVMKAVDAAGRHVQERTVDLTGRMGAGTTSLSLRIDGKRLLIASQPVTVTITAAGGGESAAVTLQVPASGR